MDEWLWWIGGGVGAGVAFFFVTKFFGWKIGAAAAGVIAAFGWYKGKQRQAAEEGARREAERQQREQAERIRRGREAAEQAKRNPPDETDPYYNPDL